MILGENAAWKHPGVKLCKLGSHSARLLFLNRKLRWKLYKEEEEEEKLRGRVCILFTDCLRGGKVSPMMQDF